jgi:hypothetical protein
MQNAIYEQMKAIATAGSVTTYSEIAPLAALDMSNPDDRNKISEILDDISMFEHEQHHPLLSTVVIHKDNNMPGQGYFKMARRAGVYEGSDDFLFFINELRRVHDFWKHA